MGLIRGPQHTTQFMQLTDDVTVAEILQLAGTGKRVVFVSGNFNIIHPGHLRLLNFAADCGDFLVVGVNAESQSATRIPKDMRLEGVRVISLVDYAFILNEAPEHFIAKLKPAVVVKGKEHEGLVNPEKPIVDSYGGKLLFSSGEVRFSSMDLLRKEYAEVNFSAITKPPEFPARHGFAIPEFKRYLSRLSDLRVMVIGDLIVDEYIDCDPLGMSQEDPTIVVTPLETKRFVGGAAIVAAHARGLGAQVRYFTVAGEDDDAVRYASATLESYGVQSNITQDDSRPTTLKQRYRAGGKTLLRVSHLRQHDVRPDILKRMLDSLLPHLAQSDLVMFSDFNYGCLPQALVDEIVRHCEKHGIAMVADSQASSQVGDVSRFPGMRLLTPTEREARLALHDWSSGLAVVAEKLRDKARAENVVITLGAEGMLIYANNSVGAFTDRLPAMNVAPRDPAGAGDSFFACASMALCVGMNIWQASYLGALAAACQVSRVGNTPLTQQDLIAEIDDRRSLI